MSDFASALDLLKHDVPLALLFDLAGFAPSSEELYRTEGSRVETLPLSALLTVAS